MTPWMRDPPWVDTLKDGTVKQINPFSGTEVWTVPGRGNRPAAAKPRPAQPIDQAAQGAHCVFCELRYSETPPEKARLLAPGTAETNERTETFTSASSLFDSAAEFRRVPNLFEILPLAYWVSNYGYELPTDLAGHCQRYLSEEAGREHVRAVLTAKRQASGEVLAGGLELSDLRAGIEGFFGSTHDLIIARRHFQDDAQDDSALASSGTLTPAEHRRFMAFTVAAMRDLYRRNRYVRYVSVFQNWLRPAGASLDHLHKQLAGIDTHGAQYELALDALRANPEVFNERAANYAAYNNLMIAENSFALAFAGFGHRFPTVEVFSKSKAPDPWHHSREELAGMSDLVHAIHAAIGPDVPANEEWHSRPIDAVLPSPWRIMLKQRTSTLAGFEGATKIYINTVTPYQVRDQIVEQLYRLRRAGLIAPGIRIATEVSCQPNPLRYTANRGVR
ncbi:MAG: DUF4921 family protein [Bifidobacteriaceae bacterium]|jgi:galactose-1-phosphate uridylyltransferase|nr:DUF4921 family protein [Bifidobacteriaceae bacterium]